MKKETEPNWNTSSLEGLPAPELCWNHRHEHGRRSFCELVLDGRVVASGTWREMNEYRENYSE